MRMFNWRTMALVALTSSALAAYSVAQQSTSGDQSNSGQSQSGATQSTSNSSNKDSSNSNANNSQSNRDQKQQDAKDTQAQSKQQQDQSKQQQQDQRDSQKQQQDRQDSQKQSNQNQSNQNRDDRSNTNSPQERSVLDRSSSSNRDRDSDRENTRDRDNRDSNRTDRDNRDRDRDDRNYSRERSSRDNDRDNDRNSSNRDRDSSRDHARRGNLRGPDIGIWFSRSGNGLVIADVSTRGPIAKLGFREGDRIVSVNGQRVASEDEFLRYLVRSDARRVTVIVYRNNREETIYVEPAVLIDDNDYVEVDPLERFGIIVDDRYDDRIVVWRVIPRSPAYYAGFRPGDVIVKFGDHPYRTRTEFERGSREWKPGDVSVQVRRGDRTRDLNVDIPNVDRSDRRSERSQVREERTAQRDTVPTDQRPGNQTDQSDRQYNKDQRDNRGGILNNIRPRANR